MFSDVRNRVLKMIVYYIPQEICLDVFGVSEVEAASCRASLVEVDTVPLPLVFIVDKGKVETLVV